jgi:anti-anti-sigma factor
MPGLVPFPARPKRRPIRSLVARLRSARPRDGASQDGRHEELHLRSRQSRGRYLVEASGALNARTRGELAEALADALETDAAQIVLDLGSLESIDHAGLDTVLTAHLRAGDKLRVLIIVPGPDPVQRVFDDARAPFFYVAGTVARSAGRARSRGSRRERPASRPHSGRH